MPSSTLISAIQYGATQHWLLPFSDPRVGSVCANIRVLNSTASLLTRLQEIEYVMQFPVGRLAASHSGILDTGLGDDTDMTMKFLK